jgi:acyl-CoA reductase-like NAD-dependent aldehyde dehydrogenase
VNSGRSCINCSGIWAPRHTREIADALAERLGGIEALPPDNDDAQLAAFTVKGQAEAINADIEATLETPGAEDMTAAHRSGSRWVEQERCDYMLPTIIHCDSPEHPMAGKEYMFPFATVVQCPQDRMIGAIGDTLVGTGITNDAGFRQQLLDAPNIDRLNLGPVPTISLNWLQPHEGNLVDFLYRTRAFQQR